MTDTGSRIPSTVRVGGVGKPGLLHSLRLQGVQLNYAAEALFQHPQFTTLSEIHLLEMASLSVAELGFSEGATYPQITARALEAGLTECPLELGPHLRVQFPDQLEAPTATPSTVRRAPPGSIIVASPPLDDEVFTPRGFYLRRLGGALWLRGYWSSIDHVWAAPDVFVFSRGLTKV